MSDLISIKGGREGLRLRLEDTAEWSDLMVRLEQQLVQNQSFFNGARLTLDVGERSLSTEQLTQMLELMQQHGVSAEAISANDREARNAARTVGLTARPLPRYPEPATSQPGAVLVEHDAMLLMRTVRSGQVLRHSGHITLIGDVNPGGELIAGGSVVVWGRLRGFVHAGALGNAEALVCAIELSPTQLRIAEHIAITPRERGPHSPEVARIEGNQIVVEPWEALKR